MIQLDSLQKAIISLEKAIHRYQQDIEDEEIRDSVIQRFEYTYELCWKMLRRELQSRAAVPSEIVQLDFKNLIREGAQAGLIDIPERWFEYRRYRNITSHTYDEKKANLVAQQAVAFLEDAKQLLQQLQS
jgi:nucleotidyltransferase substrate binding protein (TIGR01987 family)